MIFANQCGVRERRDMYIDGLFGKNYFCNEYYFIAIHGFDYPICLMAKINLKPDSDPGLQT